MKTFAAHVFSICIQGIESIVVSEKWLWLLMHLLTGNRSDKGEVNIGSGRLLKVLNQNRHQ